MIVYLDSCVYQKLKQDECKDLLGLVISDTQKNIYCFSEAHLYDLSRDLTDYKFSDMQFIEKIAGKNCSFFRERTRFENLTPAEYYDHFDWTDVATFDSLFLNADSPLSIMNAYLKAIPLDFKALVLGGQFPEDMPEEFKLVMETPVNLYDFIQVFMGFTEDISTEQKKFGEMLRYLHKNSLLPDIYKSLGIEGYFEGKITDKLKFIQSYEKHFRKDEQKQSIYDLFMQMYSGLEMFGLVKGKPKKQKMINLGNDGRHAFFGAHGDIVVSTDEDFINKTRFLYEACDIGTMVIHLDDLEMHIKQFDIQFERNFIDLLGCINSDKLLSRLIRQKTTEEGDFGFFSLEQTYFSYFNALGHVITPHGGYWFFTKERNNYAKTILMIEIKRVVSRLVMELGPDMYGDGEIMQDEVNDDRALKRYWKLDQQIIELSFTDKINMTFFPIGYLQAEGKIN